MKKLRINKELIVFPGSDIPSMSLIEWNIFLHIEENIKNKGSNLLTLDEIFYERTFSKRQRFELISRLKKMKAISVSNSTYPEKQFLIIPKDNIKNCEDVRIYRIKKPKDRFKILKSYR